LCAWQARGGAKLRGVPPEETQIDRIEAMLDRIDRSLRTLRSYVSASLVQGDEIMQIVDDIVATVAEETTIVAGVKANVDGVAAMVELVITRIEALKLPDPRLAQILADAKANKDALVAAKDALAAATLKGTEAATVEPAIVP
jgi:hypothetical protein